MVDSGSSDGESMSKKRISLAPVTAIMPPSGDHAMEQGEGSPLPHVATCVLVSDGTSKTETLPAADEYARRVPSGAHATTSAESGRGTSRRSPDGSMA